LLANPALPLIPFSLALAGPGRLRPDDGATRDLWERQSADARPLQYFQTARWAQIAAAYDQAIGRRPTLLIVDTPRGCLFLPLSIARECGCRVARVLAEPLAEYTTGAGEAIGPEDLARALAVLRQQHRVDLLLLRRVPDDSSLAHSLAELGATTQAATQAPYTPLAKGAPAPNARGGLPAAYRDACRLRRRLAGPGYAFEVFAAGPEARQAMEHALAWKLEWVKERALVSRVGTDHALNSTFGELYATPGLGAYAGVLRLDGEPVAIETGFRCGKRFFAGVRAYRPDRKKDGVGKVAIAETLEWCAREGVSEYDHGPPGDAYKFEWAEKSIALADRVLPLTWRGRFHADVVEKRMKPAVHAVLERMPVPVRTKLLRFTRYSVSSRPSDS
jgi:CelD/BcsL family acetyltransferase involved in cellulose biosynthesis